MQFNTLSRFVSYTLFGAFSFLPIQYASSQSQTNLIAKVNSPNTEQHRIDWVSEMVKKYVNDSENNVNYPTNSSLTAQFLSRTEEFDNFDFNIKPKKSKDPRYKIPDPFFTNPVGFANNVLNSWDYAFEDALNQNMTRFELESSYVAHVSIKTKKPIFGFTPRIDLGIAQGSPNGRSAQGCTISFKREF